MADTITHGRRVEGLEAVELAAQTGQDVWRSAHECMSAGAAMMLINTGRARFADFYTFEPTT